MVLLFKPGPLTYFAAMASSGAKKKLTAPNPGDLDHFGNAVALSGDTALIEQVDSQIANEAGASYVFVRLATTWTFQAKLTASDGVAEDRFGVSLDIDGDVAVIAAVSFQQPVQPGNLTTDDTYAYIFDRDVDLWTEREKIVTGLSITLLGNNANDFASISGCSVVVGLELADPGQADAGRAEAYLIEQCPCIEPPENLISWWPLDDINPVADQQGNNDGVAINNPTVILGIVDNALQFDGNQHVGGAPRP